MAIDPNQTKNSLFGGLKKESVVVLHEQPIEAYEDDVKTTPKTNPKWQGFDKVTTLLTSDQKEALDRIAKKLMKFRSNALKGETEKERITANTIVRALIEYLISLEDELKLEVLSSEEDVHFWIERMLSQKELNLSQVTEKKDVAENLT